MKHGSIASVVALLVLMGPGASVLRAQFRQPDTSAPRERRWTFGAGVAGLNANLASDCGGQADILDPGLIFTARRNLRPSVALAFTAALHAGRHPACIPGAGTYVAVSDNPLVGTFAATDARVEVTPHVGRRLMPIVAAGVGTLFSGGTPAPYGLVLGGLGISVGQSRVTVLAEYQRLRQWGDLIRRTFAVDPTYQYPVLVSQQHLGRGGVWTSARLVALRFDFAVKTPR